MKPTILVIVGISGDLAQRKLLPAIREIAKAGALPNDFKVIGVSRRNLKHTDLNLDNNFWTEHLELLQMDLNSLDAYKDLATKLQVVETSMEGTAQKLFYLSIPPNAAQKVVQKLGESGLAKDESKLLLEKPFGVDLESAQLLVDAIKEDFKEEQVYRIDHYLAKEMAQNLVVFRSANPVFSNTWNNKFLASIEIIASETIGIEGRDIFYEQTGALRDVVQSHLLQLLALTVMDLPKLDDWQSIPRLRCQALKSLRSTGKIVRGQYEGYKKEVKNEKSKTETFVSMQLESSDPSWQGVPIRLTTGKSLDVRTTEIRLSYKGEGNTEANLLTLHIQPHEGAEVCLWVKKPGYERQLQQIPLSFEYKQYFDYKLPDAYERVFVDAMHSDRTLFSTSEEVLASWEILAPVQEAWAKTTDDLKIYPKASAPQEIITA